MPRAAELSPSRPGLAQGATRWLARETRPEVPAAPTGGGGSSTETPGTPATAAPDPTQDTQQGLLRGLTPHGRACNPNPRLHPPGAHGGVRPGRDHRALGSDPEGQRVVPAPSSPEARPTETGWEPPRFSPPASLFPLRVRDRAEPADGARGLPSSWRHRRPVAPAAQAAPCPAPPSAQGHAASTLSQENPQVARALVTSHMQETVQPGLSEGVPSARPVLDPQSLLGLVFPEGQPGPASPAGSSLARCGRQAAQSLPACGKNSPTGPRTADGGGPGPTAVSRLHFPVPLPHTRLPLSPPLVCIRPWLTKPPGRPSSRPPMASPPVRVCAGAGPMASSPLTLSGTRAAGSPGRGSPAGNGLCPAVGDPVGPPHSPAPGESRGRGAGLRACQD